MNEDASAATSSLEDIENLAKPGILKKSLNRLNAMFCNPFLAQTVIIKYPVVDRKESYIGLQAGALLSFDFSYCIL
jgi:hypothetical protein